MLLTRDYQLRDAEIGGDGRTLVLACVPFDQPTTVDDGQGPYREVFRRGAFAHIVPAARRTELRYAHRQDGPPYGFGLDLVEDPKYLIGRFRVAPSEHGDQVLALVRDDQLGGVSIGYVAGHSRETQDAAGPLVERLRAKALPEVSLTPTPAYVGAEVLAVRESSVDMAAQRELARLRWDMFKARL